MNRRTALALLLALSCAQVPAAEAPLPTDSIYQLSAHFDDQDGNGFTLAQRRGQPQLVAMFYTSCPYVCPLIIDSLKGVDKALTEAERSRLRVLLVSFDPARDDVAALRAVFDERRLEAGRWTLARTDDNGVRQLAAVLGVRYRALEGGEFNHTSELVLLDAEGRKLASSARLDPVPDPEFVKQVRTALE